MIQLLKVPIAHRLLDLREARRKDRHAHHLLLLWRHGHVEDHAIKVIALDVDGLALVRIGEDARARRLRYDPVSRLDVDAATREALARHHREGRHRAKGPTDALIRR